LEPPVISYCVLCDAYCAVVCRLHGENGSVNVVGANNCSSLHLAFTQ